MQLNMLFDLPLEDYAPVIFKGNSLCLGVYFNNRIYTTNSKFNINQIHPYDYAVIPRSVVNSDPALAKAYKRILEAQKELNDNYRREITVNDLKPYTLYSTVTGKKYLYIGYGEAVTGKIHRPYVRDTTYTAKKSRIFINMEYFDLNKSFKENMIDFTTNHLNSAKDIFKLLKFSAPKLVNEHTGEYKVTKEEINDYLNTGDLCVLFNSKDENYDYCMFKIATVDSIYDNYTYIEIDRYQGSGFYFEKYDFAYDPSDADRLSVFIKNGLIKVKG